jgi:hypothetical protein
MSSSLNVSSTAGSAQQTQWTQANNPFQQLSQALASGNLSAAQQAFATIQQNAPQGVAQNGQGTTSQNAQQSAFTALAQALQAGNLTAAQQAFAQLKQTGGGHHHHHHGQGGGPAAAAGGDTIDITGNTGTINIVEGGQTATSTASATTAAGAINISGNTGTVDITI